MLIFLFIFSSIYSTFISPWSDTQTLPGLNVEPGYYLPACYRNVQATPPAHQRMRTFSDEILFYVFYCMPKDIAQEAAAQELYVIQTLLDIFHR